MADNSIKKAIGDSIDRTRMYNGVPLSIRLKIYTGPALTQDGKVFQSVGYYPRKHMVYAVKPDTLKSLNDGRYHIEKIEIDNIKAILNINSANEYINEVRSRRVAVKDKKPKLAADEYVGSTTLLNENNDGEIKSLLELLAFYKREVHLCTVHPSSANGGDKTTLADMPNVADNDVEALVKLNGYIDTSNVWFVPSAKMNAFREIIKAVPRGGGIKENMVNNIR